MKYSPADQPIRVSGQAADGIIAITVEDHGIGIPKEDLPFLMQPFFRSQNAQNLPGTGLGLSLAGHILKLHGGSLQIKSREAYGTTVTITLPQEGAAA
jgi:signal transduction histidine kinase